MKTKLMIMYCYNNVMINYARYIAIIIIIIILSRLTNYKFTTPMMNYC